MDLDKALSAHLEWKMKLRGAMQSQSQLDANAIGKDNCCPLGMWLHGEARQKFGRAPAYMECVSVHAGFHREAGKVAHLINQKRFAEAETAMGPGTPFTTASTAAGVAIGRLKKEAANMAGHAA